jgi:predicted transglutaminase-like cysteine proteinase
MQLPSGMSLLARGWPSRSLLLSEVVIPTGEHHQLLVVRVKNGDLVLDNLSDIIFLGSNPIAAKSDVLDARAKISRRA